MRDWTYKCALALALAGLTMLGGCPEDGEGAADDETETGEEGLTGEQDDAGSQGHDGQDGKDGKDGQDGKDGEDGEDGHDGADGHDGHDGEDGHDGHDGEGLTDDERMVLDSFLAMDPPEVTYEPRTRVYYVAAEEVIWDYAPQDQNVTMGRPFNEDEEVFVVGDRDHLIGDTYKKALFVEYTDATFTTRAQVPNEWEHKGTVGPIIRGVVGDTIEVVFKNLTPPDSQACDGGPCAYSMHPHGVFYDKASEGAASNDGHKSGADAEDDAVAPGDTHTYVWEVPERAGPADGDGSSIAWPYHSHVQSIADTNSGLFGAIIITAAAYGTDDARPSDVDVEVVTAFTVMDENVSHYVGENAAAHAPNALWDEEFEESNLMHVMNGYVFGNGPMPSMHVGDNVRWYLLAAGTEVDLHTPHWHGNTGVYDHRRVDVVELLPASAKVVDMVPDNPGIWLYHCHVNDHIAAGMTGRYQVEP